AVIQYTTVDPVDYFRTTWAKMIRSDMVRVEPKNLTNEEKAQRTAFCYKLTGLPRGTTAYDLVSGFKETKVKACAIPFHPKTYRPMNHAYVYFASQEDADNATEKVIFLDEHQLQWVHPELQHCHGCGQTGHVIKECDNLPEGKPKLTLAQQNLYRRTRPA